MKTLLTTIQTRLRAQLTDIRDGDIFIAPHINFLPGGVKAPAIGIKDGAVTVVELGGAMQETHLRVHMVVWVGLPAGEDMIIGRTGQKGVLDRAADLHGALGQHLLGIDGMISAGPIDEAESELFGDGKGRSLIRKIITYAYEKEEPLWGTD